jgi:hypothetical protein
MQGNAGVGFHIPDPIGGTLIRAKKHGIIRPAQTRSLADFAPSANF